ncbi:MAG: hypothetical protein D6805_01475 [Planctomycetota bacterium]|nr:MAG: hypothetical protein D6805_01475 [Planctomycetota bacterium]
MGKGEILFEKGFLGERFSPKSEKFLGGGGRGNTFFKKGSPYKVKVFRGREPFFEKGSEKKSFWEV